MMNMEISQMVEMYGNQAEEEIVNDLGIRKKGKKYYCPFHSDGKVPNLSYDDKRNQFKCFACGETYDIYKHYTEHYNLSNYEAVVKLKEKLNITDDTKYKKPKKTKKDKVNKKYDVSGLTEVSNKTVKYLNTRGISEKTIEYLGVKEKDGLIAIIYYDEYGENVGMKYRRPDKYNNSGPKYWSETNSNFILYNFNNIKNENSIIITEGEIDAMVLYECGFENVTSIPTGANSNDEWINTHWEYLKNLDEIILCFDNDGPGISGMEEVSRRLNNENKNKIRFVELNCKDANLEFHKNGKESLIELVKGAEFFGKDEYINVSKVERNIQKQKRKVTGFKAIDYAINGLINGRSTLITSRTSEGKSTFVNEVIINNIEEGNKIFAYVGEDTKQDFKEDLFLKIAGHEKNATFVKTLNVRPEKFVKKSVYDALSMWADKNLFLHHADDYKGWHHDKVFKAMERAVKKDGVKLLIIDNLMKILVTNSSEIYIDQANFVEKVTKFDKKFGTHTIIVAHAKKGKGKGYSMGINDNMGSSNIINKIDNVIAVYRVIDNKFDDKECNHDGIVEILKGRKFGEMVKMYTKYDKETRSLKEVLNADTSNERISGRSIKWKQYLSDDIDKNTYEKIEVKKGLENSPF